MPGVRSLAEDGQIRKIKTGIRQGGITAPLPHPGKTDKREEGKKAGTKDKGNNKTTVIHLRPILKSLIMMLVMVLLWRIFSVVLFMMLHGQDLFQLFCR